MFTFYYIQKSHFPQVTYTALLSFHSKHKLEALKRSCHNYRIHSSIREFFSLPKQSQKSRSILQDGSRFLGCLGREPPTIATLYATDLNIIGVLNFWRQQTLSYSQTHTCVHVLKELQHSTENVRFCKDLSLLVSNWLSDCPR